MYRSNIFPGTNQAQKDTLKNQSYSNDNIFDHQKFSYLSRIKDSTNSLPSLLGRKTSFAQFISDEKYNLQFFHSSKETREITDNRNDKKKLIRNFHSLPYNVPDNYYLAFPSMKLIYDEKTGASMAHSVNVAVSTLSTVSTAKRTPYIRNILAHKPIGINNINKKRRLRCVEPHVNYPNNEQTKAAHCFILQLNTYVNQKELPSQKQLDIQSKKLDVSPEKLIELETNTTLNSDLISKSYINDPHLARINDSIDISMQLSDNLETISNENDVLLAFYNQPIINNRNIEHVTDMPTKSLQEMQTSMKSLENIEMKDSRTNRTKIDIHQQLTKLNASTTNSNFHISKSSIDLRNLFTELNETQSSVPLHSRCSVTFEFADREQHLVEVIELSRSSHRISHRKSH